MVTPVPCFHGAEAGINLVFQSTDLVRGSEVLAQYFGTSSALRV